MSPRDAARHRSPQRVRTLLNDAVDVVGGQVLLARRSGAVLAVSTGLVASIGLPARAVGSPSVAQPSTLTAVAAAGPAAFSDLRLAAPSSQALSAPSVAKVTFDTSMFAATPAPAAAPVVKAKPAVAKRAPAKAGRSTARKALSTSTSRSSTSSAATGSSVLDIAARYVGTPYVYGGTTPSGFDCSGYVAYVYRKLGVSLPRTADAQMNATTRISKSQARPGDLVFFVSGDHAYHDGIYAGDGMLYDAPRVGKSVSKRAIWDATIVFGRVSG